MYDISLPNPDKPNEWIGLHCRPLEGKAVEDSFREFFDQVERDMEGHDEKTLRGKTVTVNAPCGSTMSFDRETPPTCDIPCPCGNPKHFLVKWNYGSDTDDQSTGKEQS